MFSKSLLLSLFVLAILVSACKNDDEAPAPPNEEEVITIVIVSFVDLTTADTASFTYRDPDGDGPIDPVRLVSPLKANTIYQTIVNFYNTLDSPIDTITYEILEEANEHQLFVNVESSLNVQMSYLDADTDGNPIGLVMKTETGDVSSGEITFTLRHQPDKYAEGVSAGDITNAGGETDVEITFDVNVQ